MQEAAEQQEAGGAGGSGGSGSGGGGGGAGHGTSMARGLPSRHVTGKDLCLGLRDMAIERYGQLAPTVLRRMGLRRTADFGTLVYAMIDRGEMRISDDDTIGDFRDVYDFDEAFSAANLRR